MRNFLIIFVLVVIAVNVYGFLFSNDGRSQEDGQASTVEQTRNTEPQNVQASEEVTTEVSLEAGASIYDNTCAACHGRDGGGVVGPALADNDKLADTSHVVKRILKGGGGMPAFGRLSDEEITNVASFIRSSWGNEFGPVTTNEVQEQR